MQAVLCIVDVWQLDHHAAKQAVDQAAILFVCTHERRHFVNDLVPLAGLQTALAQAFENIREDREDSALVLIVESFK
jgi:hypothetical protein